MAAIDITGAGGGGISNVTGTSPVVVTIVGTARNVSLDQTQFKTINGNSIFGAGNIVISAGLTNWTEAFNSGTQATSSFTALNVAANVNAALIPKGTGAIVAQIPDGTASGGNARGANSVDLQLIRGSANQVVSGNRSFAAGSYNVVSNSDSGAIGLAQNIGSQYSFAAGYANNLSSGNSYGSGVFGQQNTIVSNCGFIAGQSNVISSFRSGVIGDSNSITNSYGWVSGNANSLSGNAGTISGQNNTVSGDFSQAHGSNCTASAIIATAIGYQTNAYLYGQRAHSNGRFSINGDAQGSETILRIDNSFTDAQTKEMFLDGASLRITGPTNSAMTVNIDIVAIVTAISGTATGVTVGDMFSQNEICAYKNIAGTGTVVGSQSIQKLHDLSMTACDTAFATTGAALQVFFTGPNFAGGGSVTLRVVAKARIVETRY